MKKRIILSLPNSGTHTETEGPDSIQGLLELFPSTTGYCAQTYLGKRLQGSGWKPLKLRSEPTAMGWSETTWTACETPGLFAGKSIGV